MQVPDSGHTEEGDTVRVHARALNGNGDSVAATIVWESLDTAHLVVVDDTAGILYAKAPSASAAVEARAGTLRSNPVTLSIQAQADTLFAADSLARDSVSLGAKGDSLSDSLGVLVEDLTTDTLPTPLANRPVRFQISSTTDTSLYALTPDSVVLTNFAGIAYIQVKHKAASPPDSAVVTVTAVRGNGTPVPGSGITFTFVFYP